MESTCVLSWKVNGKLVRHSIEGGSAVLGRDSKCEIRINLDTISRRHALFRYETGGWYVSDLGSRNRVYVNEVQIEKHSLEDGDRILVGEVELFCGLTRGAPSNAEIVLSEAHPDESIARSIRMDDLAASLSEDSRSLPLSGHSRQATSVEELQESSISLPIGMPLLELFQTASETLLSGRDLDSMLDRVLELIFRSLPKIERGLVCLLEEDDLVARAHRSPVGAQSVHKVNLSRSVADSAIKEREAVLVQDARLDERFNTAESIVALRIRSAMCAPLTHGDEVLGIVYVDSTLPGQAFTEDDLALLSTLSMLSAVAVEQARLREEMEWEKELRGDLSKFLPPQLVDQLVEGEVSAAEAMKTREAEITVFFADMVGFTRLSEQLSATEITALLNEIFAQLTEVIFQHGGTIDKYNGDEIVAFFGAPKEQPDHAVRAVRACLGMQKSIEAFNENPSQDRPKLEMRIGVNTGFATVGGIGHPKRLDYSVIGDVVNTAKRLESTVCPPGEVVVGAATRTLLSESFICEELEPVPLKGKSEEVIPWRVLTEVSAQDSAEEDQS